MKVKLFEKKGRKLGQPPGTLQFTGTPKVEKVVMTVIDYDDQKFQEKRIDSIKESFPFKNKPTVTWINIDGLHQVDIIDQIGQHFQIHPLVLEDILSVDQRPKCEDLGNYMQIVLKMITFKENEIQNEQVTLIIGDRYLISFQEKPGDVFEVIRERIRTHKGRIRQMGPDYLAYSLVDAIVDNYFLVIENLGENIEILEDEVMTNPDNRTMQKLHTIKRNLLFLRKSIWPLRELISTLYNGESKLVKKQTMPYFRDLYDHTIRVVEMIETMRDMNAGMFDMYLSSISNKMNEVMKVLTIIATIFIPLTFIAGIYGMNFEYMPELKWRIGYFIVWGMMAVVAIVMVIFFKKRKWL
ncbi:magnesium/cobalt transporter CorA [bacterium]|nr:magnesium/cobalt transporter CorA [bacterium]RQV95525.1 MAG: magnesium/cobalt transporter CorA [bacterium]